MNTNKPRTIRLTDEEYKTLQEMGGVEWLRKQIRKAVKSKTLGAKK